MTMYRETLPPVPFRMRALPVQRGYPVPWFVADQEFDGGRDFRVGDFRKAIVAVKRRLCWVCGQPLMATLSFVIGPMCAITRTTAEPGCHAECAAFSAIACPFLNHTEKRRNAANLPDVGLPPGIMIERQPGVACVWRTPTFRIFDDGKGGMLLKVGNPIEVRWYAGGRAATRAEVLESIDSGYPLLLEQAELDGPEAIEGLDAARGRVLALLPKE